MIQCIILVAYYTKFKTYKDDKSKYLENKDRELKIREDILKNKEECCSKLENINIAYNKFAKDMLTI